MRHQLWNLNKILTLLTSILVLCPYARFQEVFFIFLLKDLSLRKKRLPTILFKKKNIIEDARQ